MVLQQLLSYIRINYSQIDIESLTSSEEPWVRAMGLDSIGLVNFIIGVEELFEKEFKTSSVYNMNNNFMEFVKIIEQEII